MYSVNAVVAEGPSGFMYREFIYMHINPFMVALLYCPLVVRVVKITFFVRLFFGKVCKAAYLFCAVKCYGPEENG